MEAESLESAGRIAIRNQANIASASTSQDEKGLADPNTVDFDVGDPINPIHWPAWRKWIIVILVSSMNMLG